MPVQPLPVRTAAEMLQLLALIAMEPPAAMDADSIRDEKRKVLRALRPMTAEDAAVDSVRGRYTDGVVDGKVASDTPVQNERQVLELMQGV